MPTPPPGVVMGADGMPIPNDPYPEDNYDDAYNDMDKDPYYETEPSESQESEETYLDNPYPD